MRCCDIGVDQLKLLKKVKFYLEKRETLGKDNALDSSCYLNSWATGTLGYKRLKYILKGFFEFPEFLFNLFKDVARSGYSSIYEIINNESDCRPYNHVVISWATISNFLADGSFQCPYFGVNSAHYPNVLWFLSSLDNKMPKKINHNIRIYAETKINNFSFTQFLKNLWGWLTRNRVPSPDIVYAEALASIFVSGVLTPSIKSVLVAYEAQPWQHILCLGIKKANCQVKTIGYLHSTLPPLPTDFMRRRGEPDFLFVHGLGQKKILHDYLNWQDKDIKVIKSLRYEKKEKQDLSNKILIPYDFVDSKHYVNLLWRLFENMKGNLPWLAVKNHPLKAHSDKHIFLIQKIQSLLSQHKDNMLKESGKKVSIALGSTSCVIECLARGIEVIHLVSNPIFESYSSAIWQGIKVDRLSKNIFIYRQEKRDEYIYLNDGKSDINTIFNSIQVENNFSPVVKI